MNFRTVQPGDPAWLQEAFSVLGLSEIAGGRHEKRILAMYRSAGHEIAADEVPWCAAFVNWCLSQAGIDGTGSLMARSFTKYGKGLHRTDPIPRGAIAIWPRGKPPSGHVNLVLYDDGTYVHCIGGNQSKEGTNGAVTIARYAKGQAVAYRWPLGAPKPATKPKPAPAPLPPPPDIEPVPQEPEKDMSGLKNSRTIAGGTVATTGTIGTAATEAAQTVEPLAYVSKVLMVIFIGLTLAGIGWMLYARWDDAGRPLPWKGKK
jgi:uncharacterized protein (TIGR02594 family)